MKSLFRRTVAFVANGFGKARLRRARRLEALGLLEEATASYISAGRELDAVRVLLQRAGTLAAVVFASAGDVDGQTGALIAAGNIERLDDVLSSEQLRVREHRRREELQHEVRQLDAGGRRRAALLLATECRAAEPRFAELVRELEARLWTAG